MSQTRHAEGLQKPAKCATIGKANKIKRDDGESTRCAPGTERDSTGCKGPQAAAARKFAPERPAGKAAFAKRPGSAGRRAPLQAESAAQLSHPARNLGGTTEYLTGLRPLAGVCRPGDGALFCSVPKSETPERQKERKMKEDNVLFQIKSLERLLAKKFLWSRDIDEKIEQTMPTPIQIKIIEYILEHEGEEIYQKDLEKIFNIRRATVSGVLQTMEKNDLIQRITDVTDTRTKKIILNEKAKQILQKCKIKMDELSKNITEGISEEELENFIKIIQKMKQNLERTENYKICATIDCSTKK